MRLHLSLPAIVGSLPLLLLLGCANPGPPRPPALHLPRLAEALTAQRVGDQVLLGWTIPANSTEGDAIRAPVTAVLCREVLSPTPQTNSPPCAPLQRLTLAPGHAAVTDVLPPTLTTGPPSLLVYRIELFNPHSRSAGLSAPAFSATGSAPTPTGPLGIRARRTGALITWPSGPASSTAETVELKRTSDPPASAPRPKPARSLPTGKLKTTDTPGEVTLRADSATSLAAPPNGLLDPGVRDRETYTYVAQRVLAVTLAGHSLELRSPPSPPARFTFRNTFPPPPPAGLVSVPANGPTPSVDLSWEPGEDPAPLTYNIYRRVSTASAAFTRLNSEPITSPAFRDLAIQPARTYTYRVTAVDGLGNESSPSAEVHEEVHEDVRE